MATIHPPAATIVTPAAAASAPPLGPQAAPTALRDFFNGFQGFQYNDQATAEQEWNRLMTHMNWPPIPPINPATGRRPRQRTARARARKTAYARFREAFVQQFNQIYGNDADQLQSWLLLSNRLHIVPVPGNLEDARNAVLSVYVCIVDLVDQFATTTPIPQFATLPELKAYILAVPSTPGRVFPKDVAYRTGLLRYLLREITGTYRGTRRPAT